MQQNRFLFFAIIGLAIVAVAGMFVARSMLAGPTGQPIGFQPPTTAPIRLVVAPSIRRWVEEAAGRFNQQHPDSLVQLLAADGLIPSQSFAPAQATQPAAWLAEAGFILDLARTNGLAFEDAVPVASTSLAWGAFADKQAALTQRYGPLSWEALHAKATAADDGLALVMASPNNSAEGLAVLISAAAASLNTTSLTAAQVNGALPWLDQTLHNNARVQARPAEAFAASTGRSIGDLGVLDMASWGSVGLAGRPDFTLTPVQPAVTLDYPLAIRTGASPAEQATVRAFRDFLLAEAQQTALAGYAFDRAGTVAPGVQAEAGAVQALLRWAEREF